MADADCMRVCTRCKTSLPANLDNFPPHKMGKYGLRSSCRACKKIDDSERRSRQDQLARQQAWRDANKDKVRETNAAYRAAGYKSTKHVADWRKANIEHVREYERIKQMRLRLKNPEKYRAIARDYYYRNRGEVLERSRALCAKMYRESKWFNLRAKISARLRIMFADTGGKARRKTEDILGYTRGELISHIEKQFSKGMSWKKVFSGEVHIDHIIPVSHFRPSKFDSDEFRACWALSNLRPMWAEENKRKSDKILTLL